MQGVGAAPNGLTTAPPETANETMAKIASVEPFLLGTESPRAKWASLMVVVKVTTSDGVVGWGETVTAFRAKAMVATVNNLARLMVGRDPFDVESNRAEWYRHDFNSSISLESSSAMSAIDTACWDIAGKSLGVPIYRLLGGKTRDRILAYANGWYQGCVTPDEFAKAAKHVVSMGYRAMKFDPFGPHFNRIGREGLRVSEDRVRAVRDSVGQGVDLLIEHHGRFNFDSAVRAAKMLEKYDPFFVEEPTHPEDIEGLAKYRRATPLRVALGERILGRPQALLYLRESLLDFLQVDLYRIGGVTEGKKMSTLAESFDVDVAFHNAHGPILNAATLQLDTTIPNFAMQEYFYDWLPRWKRDLVATPAPVEDGYVAPLEKPGLGIEVNEGAVRESLFEGEEPVSGGEPSWVLSGTWRDPGEP